MNLSNENSHLDLSTPTGGQGAIYFIGIGGIGMSALARYFHSKGVQVSGYDKAETSLTKELVKEGIPVHYNEDVSAIPKDVDFVVYTPAVPQAHAELQYYHDHGYKVVKRSEVLGAISADTFNICVAGTHGKTTISTMIAHILRHSGYGCNAFLGGIAVNYGTNFWSSTNNTCVIEADEYDRSFLKLTPDIAIITAMDADHLDIYGDEKSMKDAYIAFGNKVRSDGLLVYKFGLNRIREINTSRKWSYSSGNDAAHVFATQLRMEVGGYQFSVQLPDAVISNLQLRMGGLHNVENALAAISVAHALDIDNEKIKTAIADFKGVKRRFEYIIPPTKQQQGGYVYPVFIDDYAHHPEEIRALLKSVRSLFPQRRITAIFQPHLYTRTRDLADEFADSLHIADTLILLPIYPAREQPLEGVNSKMIFDKVKTKEKYLFSKEELLQWAKEKIKTIDKEFGEVFITIGAGNIDTLVLPLKEIIQQA
ncbi:MAG: UDP-N-acetylmuramate--L-alanine ligase [Flavisolibacter sp.]|nr:UDP-N-acetylmuramate--L-alanine ligase [Flavisolibacter sp.]